MNKMYTPTNLNELIKNQFLFRHWKTCTVDLARPSTRASEPSCTPANQDYHQILYVQSVSIRHRHHRHHHQGNHHHGSYSCLIFGRRALLVALGLKKAVLASDQPFLKAARLGWQGQIYLLSSGKYSCLFLFFYQRNQERQEGSRGGEDEEEDGGGGSASRLFLRLSRSTTALISQSRVTISWPLVSNATTSQPLLEALPTLLAQSHNGPAPSCQSDNKGVQVASQGLRRGKQIMQSRFHLLLIPITFDRRPGVTSDRKEKL